MWALPCAQVDERAMAAREVTALRSSGSPSTSGHNTPTVLGTTLSHGPGSAEFAEALLGGGGSGGGGAGPLIRQGSMNLPKPEESGVPATHPDMCILRIRRQHLLEVRVWKALKPHKPISIKTHHRKALSAFSLSDALAWLWSWSAWLLCGLAPLSQNATGAKSAQGSVSLTEDVWKFV
jgi:hypothetical protein